ncbi:MAG: 4Fe-4S binding protein [Ancrocorticia sp.]
MCDSVSGLLRWILAHDLPTKVILTCAHARELDPAKSELGVVLQGCISHAPIGLPAQILACGVSRVEWRPCLDDPAGYARIVDIWCGLTPDLVGEMVPGKKHFRHGDVIDLAAVPLPRRVLFGAADEGPLNLADDDQARTLAALRHLRERGWISEIADIPAAAAGIRLHVSGCTACNVCVQACPHGALELRAAVGATGQTLHSLIQNTERCRSCQACVRFCPVQAITAGAQHRFNDVLEGRRDLLTQVVTRSCTRCGAVYPGGGAGSGARGNVDGSGPSNTGVDAPGSAAPGIVGSSIFAGPGAASSGTGGFLNLGNPDDDGLCSVCSYRESNPFGSQLPPELAQQLPPELAERLMRPTSQMQH